MNDELTLLVVTACVVGFLHTLTGPDHYLPFIVMGKARKWSLIKTAWITALCGLGHVGSSVILGFVGIAFGIAVSKLEFLEGMRGGILSWIFTAFGLVYMVWGIRRAIRNKPHEHLHFHSDGSDHEHEHSHHNEHLHIHEKDNVVNLTPWILFTLFVLGPCEPLIPIVMYPAAKHNYWALVIVTAVFSMTTILTMLTVVLTASFGINLFPMKTMERYTHALAGGAIFICGLGMLLLGL